MIFLEYLFWIFFIGYSYLATIRLILLYKHSEGEVFWQKPKAKIWRLAAAIGFFIFVWILWQSFHLLYLLAFLLVEYVLIAHPAVKVSERGILANALMVRWPDVLQAKRIDAGEAIIIVTKHLWQRISLQVPAAKAAAFRKMLAAKSIAIIEEKASALEPPAQPQLSVEAADESRATKQEDQVIAEKLA